MNTNTLESTNHCSSDYIAAAAFLENADSTVIMNLFISENRGLIVERLRGMSLYPDNIDPIKFLNLLRLILVPSLSTH